MRALQDAKNRPDARTVTGDRKGCAPDGARALILF